MSQKTKAIIIVLGAIIIFGLMVALIFDLFPKKEQAPSQEQAEVVIPEKDDALPENTVFDSSNAQDFAELDPFALSSEAQGALEQEARDLAEFFIERFGTYSSDARFANIEDLRSFMTSPMQKQTPAYLSDAPLKREYYAIDSEVARTDMVSFSLANRKAVFEIVLRRQETSGKLVRQFEQAASVSLIQDSAGKWKVDNVDWGKQL